MERDSFVFYRSFYEGVKKLDDSTRLAYYEAVMEYALNGEEPDEDNVFVTTLFNLIKPQIDVNNKRYENGKKGGRPKKEVYEAPQAAVGEVDTENQTETKKNQKITKEKPKNNQDITQKNQTETKQKPKETNPEPNVNVNVNVNDNDNVLKEKHKKEKADAFCVCHQTIEYLNQKCGTDYDPDDEKLYKHIYDRIKEGHTLEDFKSVIDKKAFDWIGTANMYRHLNPITLFKPIKFDVYLGEPTRTAPELRVANFPVPKYGMMETGVNYSDLENQLLEN